MSASWKRIAGLSLATLLMVGGIALATDVKAPPAAQKAPVSGKTPGKGAKIVLTERSFDCGDIFQGDKCEHVYKFKNTGTETLVIDRAQASCGCTATVLSSKEIAPGAEGSVQATFNSAGKVGKQTKTITIYSNDPDEPQARVELVSNVKVEVDVEPNRVFFGKYDKHNPQEKEVRIKGEMKVPLKITSVDKDKESDAITYTLTDATDNSGAKILKVKLSDKVNVGQFNGRLTLNTNSTKQAKVDVYVYAEITGDVEVSQDNIFYSVFPPGETRSQSVTIKDKRTSPNLKITKYEDQGGLLNLKLETVTAGTEYKLVCDTKPNIPTEKLVNGRFTGTIVVETNHPTEKTFKINYHGYIRAASPSPAAPGPKPPAAPAAPVKK